MSILKSFPVFLGGMMNEFDQLKLNVTFENGGAYCRKTGGTVLINIPPFDTENETLKCAAFSFCVHEAGHMRYTDSVAYSKAAKVFGAHKSFLNIFEDCFIESALRRTFAGAMAKLVWLRKYLINEETLENAHMLSDSALLHNYVYCYSFGSAGYFSVYQRSIAIYTECLRKRGFDDKRLEKLNEILAKAGLLFSTNDSIVLTKELLAFLFDDSNGDDGGNTSGNPEDSDDEANGDAGGNTSGNPEDSDDEANGDAGGNTSGNPEDSDDEANGGAGGSSNSESNNKSKQFDLSQAAKDLTEDSSLDAGKVLGDLLSTNESNSQEIYHLPAMPTLANISGNPTLRDGELIMSEAMKANASLRRSLHGLVQAKYAKKVGNGRKGKRLTQNAMAKLTRNDYKVFRTSKEVECESTHFHILIDSSGSMQGHRIDNTMASTMAIIESLKAFTHVKTSVYAFGYDHTTDVALIKTPEQSQKQCLDNLTRLPTRGRTPLASALMATLVKASVSGDSRNVIILLTDGLPDTPYVAKQVIQSIHEEKQIELYSLMMGKPSNGEEIFGDNYSILETMADLPNAVFEIAKKSA